MAANWIPDENPWNLPPPPEWWLTALADLHPAIVIFPGISERVYRVGERVPRARQLKAVVQNKETARMLKHGCLPVCSKLPTDDWTSSLFEWLDAHDMWAIKGRQEGAGEAAADRLDEIDRQREVEQERREADEAEQIGASAYFGLKSRLRQMVQFGLNVVGRKRKA